MPAYPDPPSHCIEAEEFMAGLQAYHAGELFDGDQPIAWRTGWRAGRAGRQLPKRKDERAWWEIELEIEAKKRAYRRRAA